MRHDTQDDIKQMPLDARHREAIRRAARALLNEQKTQTHLKREDLEALATQILSDQGLPNSYLGFAMVVVSNAHWQESFAATPFNRRLLLLPHCLRNDPVCSAFYDSVGLHCAACGACDIDGLKRQAEAAGYTVVVAEGTSSVLMKVLEGEADAILGVACLDSLEKSYQRIAELGVPHVAAPLLSNGCKQTSAEMSEILSLLALKTDAHVEAKQSSIPLLRVSAKLFSSERLDGLLGLNGDLSPTDSVALDWLKAGGKRLRPFITLATYAAATQGHSSFAGEDEAAKAIPDAMSSIAIAIEALHKASLAHDDIEDDDPYRYGIETLHRRYGVGPAINVGDYLVGLGYRLIADQASSIGPEAASDILARLAAAHMDLCRGQGRELMPSEEPLTAGDVLEAYALKTSPAFFAAIYAGLRPARVPIDEDALRQFCTYLGEGYQIQNDLEDWEQDDTNKIDEGLDALANRPTILRAFSQGANAETVEELRCIYESTGAFDKAEALLERIRARSLDLAAAITPLPVGDFLCTLVRMVLPQRFTRTA